MFSSYRSVRRAFIRRVAPSIADFAACTLEGMFEEETPLAWQVMPYRAPVYGSDGTEIGLAESLLGDEAADIFHGFALKRSRNTRTFQIPAVPVQTIIEARGVYDLDPEA